MVGLAGPVVNIVIALLIWLYLLFSGQIIDLAVTENGQNIVQMPFLWSLFFRNTRREDTENPGRGGKYL